MLNNYFHTNIFIVAFVRKIFSLFTFKHNNKNKNNNLSNLSLNIVFKKMLKKRNTNFKIIININ